MFDIKDPLHMSMNTSALLVTADAAPPALADLHEALVVMRFANVLQSILAEAPADTADRWHAAESWITRLDPRTVRRAAHQPSLDAWTRSAEHLRTAGLLARYPTAQPRRLLAELEGLIMDWATAAPDRAGGQVDLRGRSHVSLAFGQLL